MNSKIKTNGHKTARAEIYSLLKENNIEAMVDVKYDNCKINVLVIKDKNAICGIEYKKVDPDITNGTGTERRKRLLDLDIPIIKCIGLENKDKIVTKVKQIIDKEIKPLKGEFINL